MPRTRSHQKPDHGTQEMPSTRSRRSKTPVDEFSLLKPMGLMLMPVKGDGNCLFYSLSDQFYGDLKYAHDIRAKVVQHMKDNPEMYKAFISARPGGGVRQAPKRKRAGATSTTSDTALPTQDQLDLSWNNYIAHISKKGSYGDHVEVQAFARAYDVDVKIYDYQGSSYHKAEEEGTLGTRRVMHIARHDFEHYSSIRKIGGPLTGSPDIEDNPPSIVPPALRTLESGQSDIPANVPKSSDTMECGQSAAPPNVPKSSDTLQSGDEEEEEIRGPNKRRRCGTMARDSEITITIKIKIKGRKGVKHVTLPKRMEIVFT